MGGLVLGLVVGQAGLGGPMTGLIAGCPKPTFPRLVGET